jgi:transcriptional regulator with XRE-family HTH domain
MPNALRRLRAQRRWSQLDLANRAGVSLGTISIAERGGPASAATVQALAAALEVAVEALELAAPPIRVCRT